MTTMIEALVGQAGSRRLETAVRHQAFAELVNRYQGMAYRVALGVLGDGDLAQDAVQEAFVAAYQNLHQLREPAAFGGWLRQIVLTHAHREIRQRTLPTNSLDEAPPVAHPGLDPAVALETIEMKQRVMTAINALPAKEQEVTRLFYVNDYSQKEIADLLELPLSTVKKRLQYARQHLRGILAAMWATEPEPQPMLAPVVVPVAERPYPPTPDWP